MEDSESRLKHPDWPAKVGGAGLAILGVLLIAYLIHDWQTGRTPGVVYLDEPSPGVELVERLPMAIVLTVSGVGAFFSRRLFAGARRVPLLALAFANALAWTVLGLGTLFMLALVFTIMLGFSLRQALQRWDGHRRAAVWLLALLTSAAIIVLVVLIN